MVQPCNPTAPEVSNFSPEQLDCILSNSSATKPAVNQLPFSISYVEPNVLEAQERSTFGLFPRFFSHQNRRKQGKNMKNPRIFEGQRAKHGLNTA